MTEILNPTVTGAALPPLTGAVLDEESLEMAVQLTVIYAQMSLHRQEKERGN